MGIQDYPIGKLKLKLNRRQLLDGYESIEARHKAQRGDEPIEYHIHGDYVGGDKVCSDQIGGNKTEL